MILTGLQDTQRYTLTTSRGPGSMLLLSLVNNAVDALRQLRDRRKSDKPISPERFQILVKRAYEADLWLFGCSARLTFREVCLWHDFDEESFREQIYSQFDATFIDWMRAAYETVSAKDEARKRVSEERHRITEMRSQNRMGNYTRKHYERRKPHFPTDPPVSSPETSQSLSDGRSNPPEPSVAEPQGDRLGGAE